MELSKIEKEYLIFVLENQLDEHDEQGERDEFRICKNLLDKIKTDNK